MFDITNPAWWKSVAALVASFLALFNVPGDLSTTAQSVIGAAGLFVVAIFVHEHHATQRNTDKVAASLTPAPASAPLTAAQAVQAASALIGQAVAQPPGPAPADSGAAPGTAGR